MFCVDGGRRRGVYACFVGEACAWCMNACLHAKKLFVSLAWCMDVCRNVDSFLFRQIFALPICPIFRKVMPNFSGDHVCIVWF